jgi:hypothetical protein
MNVDAENKRVYTVSQDCALLCVGARQTATQDKPFYIEADFFMDGRAETSRSHELADGVGQW